MKEYNISYGATTDDEMVHVSEFTAKVETAFHLNKIFGHIIDELTEDGEEIKSINVTMKLI